MKYPEIAERFYRILAKKEMSPAELARQSGVNESSISQYVNGNHKPSNINSGKIARVLNVNPLWLMGYDVAMTEKTSYIVEESRNDNEASNNALRYSTMLVNAGFILRASENFDDEYSLSPTDSKLFNGFSVNLDINELQEYNALVESVVSDATKKYFVGKMKATLDGMNGNTNG